MTARRARSSPPRVMTTRSIPSSSVVTAGGALALALVGGAVATTRYALTADLGLALAVTLIVLLHRFGTGVAVGLLLLGGLDALPGPNLETTRIVLSLTAQELDVLVLIVVLALWRPDGAHRRQGRSRLEGWLWLWTGSFLALWLATVVRTTLSSPVPLYRAASWCMDFAFFAILLPLFARALRDARLRRVFFFTCVAGLLVSAPAGAIVVVTHTPLPLLVHTTLVASNGSLTRLYTGATDLPFAGLPLALGAALFSTTARVRILGAVVAIVCAVAVALALTRARYIGIAVGVSSASLLWLCLSDRAAKLARLRLGRAAAAILITVAALLIYHPPVVGSSALNTVAQRATSALAVTTGQGSTATVNVRLVDVRELTQYLGGRWLFGLGFLDPSSDFIVGVPQGSIRNGDVGYFNIIMTMGIVGLALYCAPLVLLVIALGWRRLQRIGAGELEWLAFGGFAWIVATLISSATLVILFSTTGVVAAAAVAALAVVAIAGSGDERPPRPAVEDLAPGHVPLVVG